jgi:glc operon protein GlcG
MRNLLFAAAALAAVSATAPASAQNVTINRVQISNDAARKIVDGCMAYAAQNKILVGIAVVGIDGVLLDFHASQGGGPTLSETALLKAKTTAHWRRATKDLEADVRSGNNGASVWIGDFPREGGIPIMIDGQFAGAIGIGAGGKWEECAQAGLDAAIPKAQQSARR